MVAAEHPLQAMAGLDALKAGGNAIDAALAIFYMTAVVEQHQSGLGGDCYLLAYIAKEKKVVFFNGTGPAPKLATLRPTASWAAYLSMGHFPFLFPVRWPVLISPGRNTATWITPPCSSRPLKRHRRGMCSANGPPRIMLRPRGSCLNIQLLAHVAAWRQTTARRRDVCPSGSGPFDRNHRPSRTGRILSRNFGADDSRCLHRGRRRVALRRPSGLSSRAGRTHPYQLQGLRSLPRVLPTRKASYC